MDAQQIKEKVREKYGDIASAGCCCSASACCTPASPDQQDQETEENGLHRIARQADLGLGCGKPTKFAGIRPGDTVLDLGSGAGADVFLAAGLVGPEGSVIGVDMTGQMIERARENAERSGLKNVHFKLGDIEDLPLQDASVNVVISNCVINLAPDKRKVFKEVYRVLEPGGRFCVSDIVTYGEVPAEVRNDMNLWAGCVAGAMDQQEYLGIIRETGFDQLCVKQLVKYDRFKGDGHGIASITVEARKA